MRLTPGQGWSGETGWVGALEPGAGLGPHARLESPGVAAAGVGVVPSFPLGPS